MTENPHIHPQFCKCPKIGLGAGLGASIGFGASNTTAATLIYEFLIDKQMKVIIDALKNFRCGSITFQLDETLIDEICLWLARYHSLYVYENHNNTYFIFPYSRKHIDIKNETSVSTIRAYLFEPQVDNDQLFKLTHILDKYDHELRVRPK